MKKKFILFILVLIIFGLGFVLGVLYDSSNNGEDLELGNATETSTNTFTKIIGIDVNLK